MQYTSKDVYEFISKQTNDPILEWKTCAVSGAEFPIYQSDLDFYNKISPSFAGKKYQIPTPTLCPEERQRRRLLWRNLRALYKRKCDATGKDIISIYAPDSVMKVYEQKIWRSDTYNPLDYGRAFDFSKTFSQQFKELQLSVPRSSLLNGFEENAEYLNHSYYNKNCYLLFAGGYSENCMYGNRGFHNKDCLDYLCSHGNNNCYSLIQCENSNNSEHIQNCQNCSYVFFSKECSACEFCIGCYGLHNKQYHLFNKPVSKETFEDYLSKLRSGDQQIITTTLHMLDELVLSSPQQASYTHQLQNSAGIELYNSRDSKLVLDGKEVENVSYSSEISNAKDCRDYDVWGENASRIYETHCTGGNVDSIMFSNVIWNGANVRYSDNCLSNAKNCFACVGLKQQEYCILNKQYTKEEYESLVPKIIEHMQKTGERGEFFHPSLSPFGYNETVAQEYLPLTREEALARGYTRQDNSYDPIIPEGADTLKGDQIPTDITSVSDDILKKIFICEVSGRPFRIIKQELEFYRKHTLPLPRKHPDVRHEERMKLRPPRELHLRHCDQCSKEMLSVYTTEYPGKVYCEECYTKEIY